MKYKILILLFIVFLLSAQHVQADSAMQNVINYLLTQLNGATGQIMGGTFGDASPWAAIAFSANGIDPSTVKSSTNAPSLIDYLKNNHPTSSSPTTEWEKWILAIVDSGNDPTSFGGINYVHQMENLVTNNQIGDKCSLNDSIFGLMAEVSAGSAANTTIEQTTLNLILSQEDHTTGGFSFSLDSTCAYPSPASADITGAAAVALTHAKSSGMTAVGLDDAIASMSNYFKTNADSDGGYGYYGSSDTDTTGWALQGLNALGLGNSSEAQGAKKYLLSQQSPTDWGIQDFNYSTNALASNSTTTSQALIGLVGKDWVLKIFDASSANPAPTTSIAPTLTPTPTDVPTPTSNSNSSSTSSPTATPQPTSQPLPSPTPELVFIAQATSSTPTQDVSPTAIPTRSEQVLGASTKKNAQGSFPWPSVLLGVGIVFLALHIFFVTHTIKNDTNP